MLRSVEERPNPDRSGEADHSGHEAYRPQEGYLLAGSELIPCSEAMQQVECTPVNLPKQLEHNRKRNYYFSADDNSK